VLLPLIWTLSPAQQVEAPPGELTGLIMKARYALGRSEHARALAFAEAATERHPDARDAAYLLMEIARELRDRDPFFFRRNEASLLAEMVAFTERFPDDYRFPMALGIHLAGDPLVPSVDGLERADHYLARSVALLEGSGETEALTDTYYHWGIWAYNGDRYYEAGTHFEKAIALEPDSIWAVYYAARAAERAHRLRTALVHFRRFASLAEGSALTRELPVTTGIAVLEALLENHPRALDELIINLRADPLPLDEVFEIAARFERMGRWSESIRVLETVAEPDRSGAWYATRADVRARDHDYGRAAEELAPALAKPGITVGPIVDRLLDMHLMQGNREALALLADRFTEHPILGAKAHIFKAFAQPANEAVWDAFAKRFEEGGRFSALIEAVDARGVETAARDHLLGLFSRVDDWGAARSLLAESGADGLCEQDDQYASILYLGGRVEDAFGCYEQLLEAHPDDAGILNNYAYFLTEEGRDPDRAVKMLTRALELEPGDDAILDSLGWACFALGETTRAEALILQALIASPDDPEKLAHLGDIYAAIGKPDAAREAWSRALQGGAKPYRAILDKLDPP